MSQGCLGLLVYKDLKPNFLWKRVQRNTGLSASLSHCPGARAPTAAPACPSHSPAPGQGCAVKGPVADSATKDSPRGLEGTGKDASFLFQCCVCSPSPGSSHSLSLDGELCHPQKYSRTLGLSPPRWSPVTASSLELQPPECAQDL